MRKAGYSPKFLSNLARNLIDHPRFATLRETLPPEVVQEYRLMPLADALRNLHFPESRRCCRRRASA